MAFIDVFEIALSLWSQIKIELSSLYIAATYAITPAEIAVTKRFDAIRDYAINIVDERIKNRKPET